MILNNVFKNLNDKRKAEVQALKYQISELENRFEDRFQTMMAEMRKYVIKFQLSFCLLL